MIHPQAIVDPSALLASDVQVGPFSVIGPNVEIEAGTIIDSHVVIKGPTKIGKGNKIFQFASIGEYSQDKKYQGGHVELHIGDNNVFREHTTVNRGTEHGGGITIIGNDNLFCNYVHIAHDCKVGDHTIFSNTTSLAGHVTIGDYVNLAGFVGVHQFCAVGERAFLGGGSMVVQDIPPYVTVSGYPCTPRAINKVGLRRHCFSDYTISMISRAYKILYREGLTLKDAIKEIEYLVKEVPELQVFLDFIKAERPRGIVR